MKAQYKTLRYPQPLQGYGTHYFPNPTALTASAIAAPIPIFQNEPDQRPTAEDTLLWLEDLTDALPDDEEEPWSPIDYESLFPIEMGERACYIRC